MTFTYQQPPRSSGVLPPGSLPFINKPLTPENFNNNLIYGIFLKVIATLDSL